MKNKDYLWVRGLNNIQLSSINAFREKNVTMYQLKYSIEQGHLYFNIFLLFPDSPDLLFNIGTDTTYKRNPPE